MKSSKKIAFSIVAAVCLITISSVLALSDKKVETVYNQNLNISDGKRAQRLEEPETEVITDRVSIKYDRETGDNKFTIQDQLTSKFELSNHEDKPMNLLIIREILPNEELVAYQGGEIKYWKMEHYDVPYLEYAVNTKAAEEVAYSVQSKINFLPVNGKLWLPQLDVINADTGEIVAHSGPSYIQIQCQQDKICDTEVGENFRNCPSDCPSGSADNFCDREEDGKCDPNCLTELDKDCKEGEGITSIPDIPSKMSK